MVFIGKKKKEEKSEMEQLEEMEQKIKKQKEELVKQHGENVDADIEDIEIGDKDQAAQPQIKIPAVVIDSVKELQKTVAAVYNTQPLDQGIIQRDETNSLLLAIYHEIRLMKQEINKR